MSHIVKYYGVYIYDIIGFMKLDWVEFNNNGVCVIRKKNNQDTIFIFFSSSQLLPSYGMFQVKFRGPEMPLYFDLVP